MGTLLIGIGILLGALGIYMLWRDSADPDLKPKPRIKFKRGMWYCKGSRGEYGRGLTPEQAYEAWRLAVRYRMPYIHMMDRPLERNEL